METDTLPQNALMILEPDNMTMLQQTAGQAGMDAVEIATQGLSALDKGIYIRDMIKGMMSLQSTVSQALMSLLWKVYSNSLWTAPTMPNGMQLYNTFREWVEGELPGYDEERSDLWDCVRICESVLPFAMQNPLMDEKGEVITPNYLIWKVGIGKMKTRRGNFEDDDTPREKKAEIMLNMTRKSMRELNQLYSKPRYEKRKMTGLLNYNPEGTADLILPALDPTQVEFVRSALGSLLAEHNVHLDSATRDTLRQLLEAAG